MAENAIAIVGMSAVFPGAVDLRQYWANNVAGVDALGPVPAHRLNGGHNLRLPAEHEARLSCLRGGFLPDSFQFDPLPFGIIPKSVRLGDPDQFLALHVVYEALRDAQVREDAPDRRHCDVIIGRGGYMSNKMSEIYLRVDGIERLMQFMARRYPDMSRAELADLDTALRTTLPESDVDSLSTCMPNIVASRVANRLNLRGAAYTVDAACASSLLAVEQAVRRLRSGECRIAVAAGLHLCQSPSFWHVFSQLGALSPSSQIRPFDRTADGLLPGEGAGAVVLKRWKDALQDGDRVYALIRGVGVASDGRETAVLAPSSVGQIQALQTAYEDAELNPELIGYIEAHGTATHAGDATEIATLKAVFGSRGNHPPTRALGSVKSMIGHTMPAAGIAALIRTALALTSRILPPSLHCADPHPGLADSTFYVNEAARPWVHGPTRGPRRAGVNAFGFGGINAHIVLEEVPEGNPGPLGSPLPRESFQQAPRAAEPLFLSAESPTLLLAQVDRVLVYLQTDVTRRSLLDVAAALTREVDFAQACKLAVVARDLSHARAALTLCQQRLSASVSVGDSVDSGSHQNGHANGHTTASGEKLAAGMLGPDFSDREEIYYSASAAQPVGKIACVFPGVGFPGLIGNYPDHLRQLCLHFPEIRREFDRIELRDEDPGDPVPTSLIFWPPAVFGDQQRSKLRKRIAAMTVSTPDEVQDPPADERNIAASGVTLTNWISWVLLQKLGVPADMLCGQSQGEMAALAAAEVFSIDQVIPKFWSAMAISPTYAGKGRLAFAGASEEILAPYLAEFEDVCIAIHVSPGTQVLGGSDVGLAELVQRLRENGIMAQGLPYPPIHTPQLGYLRDELLPIIGDDVDFHEAQRAVYSAINEERFPEGANEIRDLALKNLDHPVRFWQTIHRMYKDGARIFVQAGGGTLASNMKTILDKPDIFGVAVDLDHRDPLLQLADLSAALFVHGVTFNPSYFFQHAGPKFLDLSAPVTQKVVSPGAAPLRLDWAAFESSAGVTAAAASMKPKYADQNTEELVQEKAELDAGTDAECIPAETELAEESVAASGHDSALEDSPVTAEEVAFAELPSGSSGEPEAMGSAEGTMPLIGEVVELEPGQRIVTRRLLHLDEDLFLHDHAFLDPGGVRSVEACLPVLPLTFVMEVLAETSVCLAPGYGVIGLEKVRASRWIAMKNCRTAQLQVEAVLESFDAETGVYRVRAEVLCDGEASGAATVLLGQNYREDVALSIHEGTEPKPWPFTLDEIYRERHLFHGPLLQCVTGLGRIDEEGMVGQLTIRPDSGLFASNRAPQLLLDPVVLDGCAQLLGLWALADGTYVLPASIGKLELYRPTPPPGTQCEVRVQINKYDRPKRAVLADVEVLDEQGAVWLRIQGWNEWLFDYYPQLLHGQRIPRRVCITDELQLEDFPPGMVCCELRRETLRHANIEWLARLMLHPVEVPTFEAQPNILRQWQWLMGRIAAKDAARRLLAAREGSAEMIHPAELVVAVSEAGQPVLQCVRADVALPAISITHTSDTSVAVALEFPVGVDMEPLSNKACEVLTTFSTIAEQELLEPLFQQFPAADWPARLWCAKEAVGKALGTGLAGRPSDFEAIDATSDGRLLMHYRPAGLRFVVSTAMTEKLILAATVLTEGA